MVRASDVLQSAPPLAVWGGVECSVTRIHDFWRDQVHDTGHEDRPGDLDLIAALGIRTIRYPFIWERLHAHQDRWAWQDARVAKLRALGIRPIAGLLHHGSGPAGTSLLDPGFPVLFAQHAAKVAERYDDVLDWTPINEPLTTARFSCLYGFWYPHEHEMSAFLRAVALQCRATLLAMRAIRKSISRARLLQTEDVSRTFSTPLLGYQARHDTERGWLSLDLLCGHVDRHHAWRERFEQAGVSPAHLDELAEGEACPQVIGANHYVTSDRFLDHRTAHYPPQHRGGNIEESYADTEAVRVRMDDGVLGWTARLRELWLRYKIPLAVTEAQLGGCDQEDQVRWFMEAWDAAHTLRREGAIIDAVTAWAMVGAVDWSSLMQQSRGETECGAWDINAGGSQPRLLAKALHALATGGCYTHPCLEEAGWWRREDRFHASRIPA